MDTVAADLSRLFADTVVADLRLCKHLIEHYQCKRTLSIEEQNATIAMAQTTAMLSGFSWLDWILLEKRQFPSDEAILARLEHWDRQANRLVENMEKKRRYINCGPAPVFDIPAINANNGLPSLEIRTFASDFCVPNW